MASHRRRIKITALILSLAALAGVAAGVFMIAPRTAYYLRRADYHARMAKVHGARAASQQRLAREADSTDYGDFFGRNESVVATDHSKMKDLYSRAALRFWEPAPPDLPLPYPWDRETDREVLEAVLLRGADEPAGSLLPEAKHDQNWVVVVHESASIDPLEEVGWDVNECLTRHGFSAELSNGLSRRNRKACESLAELGFDPRRIVLADLSAIHTRDEALAKYPNAKLFVKLALPGYSAGGTHAVVAFMPWFSPNPHSSAALHGLSRASSSWRVIWSEYEHSD